MIFWIFIDSGLLKILLIWSAIVIFELIQCVKDREFILENGGFCIACVVVRISCLVSVPTMILNHIDQSVDFWQKLVIGLQGVLLVKLYVCQSQAQFFGVNGLGGLLNLSITLFGIVTKGFIFASSDFKSHQPLVIA